MVTNIIYETIVIDPMREDAPPEPLSLGIGWYAGLSVTGIVGRTYRIEYVTDLAQTNNWNTAGTVTLTNNPTFWFDPESSRAMTRYYRAVATGP